MTENCKAIDTSDSLQMQKRIQAFERGIHAFDDMLERYGFSVNLDDLTPKTVEELEAEVYEDYLAQ